MKRLLLVTVLVLLVTLMAATAVMAKPPGDFYLEKVCDGSVADNICMIQDPSDPFSLLDNGQIIYDDKAIFENPAGVFIESAEIMIVAADGSTLGGHVRFIRDHGYFTLRQGTGALTGMHATGLIAAVDWNTGTFSLTGSYHIEPKTTR